LKRGDSTRATGSFARRRSEPSADIAVAGFGHECDLIDPENQVQDTVNLLLHILQIGPFIISGD